MIDISLDDARKNLDVIKHHGVKGQKWGVTRKPSGSQITSARIREAGRIRQLNRAADRLNLAEPGSKQQKTAAKNYSDLSAAYLKNPDRLTAARMTKGEKVILGLLAVGVPGAGTAVAGTLAGVSARNTQKIKKDLTRRGVDITGR